jgi:hypothetical protein
MMNRGFEWWSWHLYLIATVFLLGFALGTGHGDTGFLLALMSLFSFIRLRILEVFNE